MQLILDRHECEFSNVLIGGHAKYRTLLIEVAGKKLMIVRDVDPFGRRDWDEDRDRMMVKVMENLLTDVLTKALHVLPDGKDLVSDVNWSFQAEIAKEITR